MSDNRRQIYCKSKFEINTELERLDLDETITDGNRILIRRFVNHMLSNDSSKQRCKKISNNLRTSCRLLKKDLDKLDKEDLVDAIVQLKSITDKAESTKRDYVMVLKQFFRWYEDEDERLYSPDQMVRRRALMLYKYIKTTKLKKPSAKINPADILTDEDIKIAMKYCQTLRDKTFIRLLHEKL